MRKARSWRAFLIEGRKFSENRTAWLGREGTEPEPHRTELIETTHKTGATRCVCSISVQHAASASKEVLWQTVWAPAKAGLTSAPGASAGETAWPAAA